MPTELVFIPSDASREVDGVSTAHASVGDGLPAEITAALTRLRSLHIISRASAHRFHSFETEPQEVRDALGVGYAVNGQVDISGRSLTVDVELVETTRGSVLWAERYAGDLEQIHEIRSRIVAQLMSSLELEISRNEAGRLAISQPASLSAWEHFHLGQVGIYTTLDRDYPSAERHFGRAVELAPDFARAHAGMAVTHFWQAMNQAGEREHHYAMMSQAIDRALDLDAVDPQVLVSTGQIRGYQGSIVDAMPLLDRAIERAPGFARAYGTLGPMQAIIGDADEALVNCDRAISLSPLDPLMANLQIGRAASLYRQGRVDEAALAARHLLGVKNNTMLANLIALAVFDSVGDSASAARMEAGIREQAGRIDGGYVREMVPTADPQLIGGVMKSVTDRKIQLG